LSLIVTGKFAHKTALYGITLPKYCTQDQSYCKNETIDPEA